MARIGVAALLVLWVGLVAPPGSAKTPRTLVTERGGIVSFAQDAGGIAWIASRCASRSPPEIKLRASANASIVTLGTLRSCGRQPFLGLGGRRTLWTDGEGDCGFSLCRRLLTAALDDRAVNRLTAVEAGPFDGSLLVDTAGDGNLLVFVTIDVSSSDDGACYGNSSEPCVVEFVGGDVQQVKGRGTRRLPVAWPVLRIAVSDGRVALVPAKRDASLRAEWNGTVEVRNASSGAVAATFAPAGEVKAIAFSGRRVAVLVRAASGNRRIEWHDARTGALLGRTVVPRRTADEIDMDARRIVFRIGRDIRLLNVVTGAKRLLVRANVIPLGLSIESGRVAWVENSPTTGRVRAILL